MRLFIAVKVPAPVSGELDALLAPAQAGLPPGGWVRAEAFHLTLAFLGEQPDVAGNLVQELSARIAVLPRFSVQVLGGGFFPDQKRPRVAWVGFSNGAALSALAAAARAAVTAAGVTFDEKPFVPHLTILRIRSPWKPDEVARLGATLQNVSSTAFPVVAVTIFQSELRSGGAVHTPLATFPLAQ